MNVDDLRRPGLEDALDAATREPDHAGLDTRISEELRELGHMPIQAAARRVRENIGGEQHTHCGYLATTEAAGKNGKWLIMHSSHHQPSFSPSQEKPPQA